MNTTEYTYAKLLEKRVARLTKELEMNCPKVILDYELNLISETVEDMADACGVELIKNA